MLMQCNVRLYEFCDVSLHNSAIIDILMKYKKKMHQRFQGNRIIEMLTSQVHYENIDSIDVSHPYTYNLLDHIMHFIFR